MGDDRRQCEARYESRRSALACFESQAGGTALFVPAADPLPLRTRLRLKVCFGDTHKSFHVGGRVGSPGRRGAREPGFTLVSETPADRKALAILFDFCAGQREAAKRFRAAIACTVRVGSHKLAGTIRELSLSGAFLSLKPGEPLEAGANVDLEVRSGLLGLNVTRLKARVVRNGQRYGHAGFGVEFLEGSADVQELIEAHCQPAARR